MIPGKAEFIQALAAVSKITGSGDRLDEFVADLFCEAVEPHGWDRGVAALKTLVMKSRRFPTLAEVMEIVAPATVAEIDAKDDAAVAANRIWEAIGKYGERKTGPEGDVYQKQREFIGEAGWAVVGRQWTRICNETKDSDKTFMLREWGAAIKGTIVRARAQLPAAPALPGGVRAEALEPAMQPAALPEPGSFLDIAQREVAKVLDRKSRAAGERDEGEDPW